MHNKKIYFLKLFIISFIAGSVSGCQTADKKQVKSMATDSVYHAGKLKPADTVIKHTFFIKSTGTADLKIDSVGGSCSCIALDWEKKPIHPGDSGFVSVSVKPAPRDTGKQTQYVVVKTNSTTPLTILHIFFIR